MTHTYVIAEVSQAAYDEIRAILVEAGYQDAIHDLVETDNSEHEVLDTHGIGLRAKVITRTTCACICHTDDAICANCAGMAATQPCEIGSVTCRVPTPKHPTRIICHNRMPCNHRTVPAAASETADRTLGQDSFHGSDFPTPEGHDHYCDGNHACCQSHCCFRHGCKYGFACCPVVRGEVKQDRPCEECRDEEAERATDDGRFAELGAAISAVERPPDGKFAWLIERTDINGAYWDGRGKTFHHDPNQAVRFARKEDAERVRWWLLKEEPAESREHGWVPSAEPAHIIAGNVASAVIEKMPSADAPKFGSWRTSYHAAQAVINDLCQGRARWTMSIPARPNEDQDLVLGNALRTLKKAIEDRDAELAARDAEINTLNAQLLVVKLERDQATAHRDLQIAPLFREQEVRNQKLSDQLTETGRRLRDRGHELGKLGRRIATQRKAIREARAQRAAHDLTLREIAKMADEMLPITLAQRILTLIAAERMSAVTESVSGEVKP